MQELSMSELATFGTSGSDLLIDSPFNSPAEIWRHYLQWAEAPEQASWRPKEHQRKNERPFEIWEEDLFTEETVLNEE